MKKIIGIPSLLLALLGVLVPACVFAAEASRPNIIFILADDIGLPGCGCTGGIYKTLEAHRRGRALRYEGRAVEQIPVPDGRYRIHVTAQTEGGKRQAIVNATTSK